MNQEDFATSIGLKRTTYANYEKGIAQPDYETLYEICSKYDVTTDQLLYGVLRLESGNIVKEDPVKYGDAAPIDLGDKIIMQVPLVQQYAYAGYLSGFRDPEYISELPKIPWIVDKEHKGDYITFEVKNDSMYDGTDESYKPGDLVLGRQISSHLWQSKLHIKKWDFVIVHKTEGVLLKRIAQHNTKNGEIVLHSLNADYPDINIVLEDVQQLFNVVKMERKKNQM